MNKFILKIVTILFPVVLLHLFTYIYYSPDKGDLLRIGYILDKFPDYRRIFSKEFMNEMRVIPFSHIEEKREYDVLTIGDSFSEQGNNGYQNFLALKEGLETVHMDRRYHTNQFQALKGLLNSGFFDRYKFRYVLLQFVEAGSRGVPGNLDLDLVFPKGHFLDAHKNDSFQFTKRFVFPSDRVVKFPYYNFKRILFPNLDCNEVYALPLKEKSFSVGDSTLYFHSSNPANINNSEEKWIKDLNDFLNQLALELNEKGVELVVMPVPDKLDYYFDQVAYSGQFEKTRFFEIMAPLKKQYLYIDSFEVLKDQAKGKKDVYYFDDTHWSPVGVELIGKEISRKVNPESNSNE